MRNNTVPKGILQKLSFLLDLYRTLLHQPVETQDPQPRAHSPNRDNEDGDEDFKEKGKRKETAEEGPSGTKQHAQPAIKQTMAAKRSRREAAGKQRSVMNAVGQQPLPAIRRS